MDNKQIIKIAHKYISLLQKQFEFTEAFLFGSWAENKADENSDIDIAIITRSSPAENKVELEAKLFELIWDIDTRIEPIILIEDNDTTGFIEYIRKHGIKIA